MRNPDRFIMRLKKQKEDALEFIIDAYMPLVKAIVTKILHNMKRQDIDECINDVFLTVWQNAHQFNGDANTKQSIFIVKLKNSWHVSSQMHR